MARLRLIFSGFASITFTAGALFAQTTSRPNSEPPEATLKVQARTVVEDVIVMDKGGRAVSGLRSEDFEVFENGKPQAITFFEPNFVATEAAALRSTLPPNTFTNIPVGDPHNVTNVLLLDALNTRSTERMYAQVQMVKYMASLPPDMRIAVFTLDNERIHLIWGFNQDSSALRGAIARFTANRSRSASSSPAAQREAEREELIDSVGALKQRANQTGDDRLGESADALQHFLNHGPGIIDQYGNFFTTMNALEALAHYLAGIPGRKNLFWVAGTFPHQFKSDRYFDWYRRARGKLAEAEVSVYPIDANGVDVDTGGVLYPDQMPGSVLRYADTEAWAEETGGKAYHENDITQEIANAADHGSRYYTLAYVPSDDKEEAWERKVEVKVLSGNYTIFYRKRYFEQTQKEIRTASAAPASNPLFPLMGHGLPNFAEIPYRLKVVSSAMRPGAARAGQNTKLTGKLTRYDVGFQLQASGLPLLSDADGVRRKSLQIALMVYSQDFKPLNWEIRDIHLLIKPEQWVAEQRTGIPFHIEIDAPPGDIYLRTGVYDSSSNRVGTLEIPLSAVAVATK